MPDPMLNLTGTTPSGVGFVPRLAHRVSDELCDLWGQLFLAPPADRPKRLMITAAGRHEGVTQVACGMAVAAGLHRTDHSVVLVDLNVRHPRVARTMGLHNVPGLAEVVTSVSNLEHALRSFGGTMLSVLPAGGPQTRPLSLLAGEQLRELLDELSARFDHVLIDTPAVNAHPEAQILSPLVDGVLLVVRAGHTTRQALLQAKKRLQLADAPLLGAVLNDRVYPIPGFLYRRM
jgi:capsular exopolysaccharide synthesis family protein